MSVLAVAHGPASASSAGEGFDAFAAAGEGLDAPSAEFLGLITRDFARRHLIVSVGRRDGVERLLVGSEADPGAVANVGARLGVPVECTVGDGTRIALAIDAAYGGAARRVGPGPAAGGETETAPIERLLAQADRDLLSTDGKAPVVRLVDALLFEALAQRASDVHVQPLADRTLVRYRVDGVLHTVGELGQRLTAAVVGRIKVMGRMDIAERRTPQDGRASVTMGDREAGGRSVDLRISTLPTSYGERAVIRLLDNAKGEHLCDLASLGMPPDIEPRYLRRAGRPNGIALVTGPTGSGKTTTLYATLRWIATSGRGDLNIVTIEDPIEYELSTVGMAISQAQVNTKKGVTFATGLRHILRQDPDVIMVGEIRDAETARVAIQSSLTGHLVFSTLHTNDAAGAVTRLVDLGVEPYLVGASLSAVLAQRLVRRVHGACAGGGCEACFGTGYRGRAGVFEFLEVDDGVREMVVRGATAVQIRDHARAAGMRTLEEEGARLAAAGVTTPLEIERVVHSG